MNCTRQNYHVPQLHIDNIENNIAVSYGIVWTEY